MGNQKIIKDKSFLRQISQPVSLDEGKRIAKELQKALKYFNRDSRKLQAIGLSAPQIGILKCVSIIDGPTLIPMVMINPNIVQYSTHRIEQVEGCLSFPRELVRTERSSSVVLETETMRAIKYEGFMAVVIQHEVDHLNGVLFYDRAITSKASSS